MIVALQTLIFFRESIATVLDRWFRPYYRNFNFFSTLKAEDSEDEESEDQVFAEYDDEKGVVFYPPMYAQRYAAVSDCLMDERWSGELEKVVDLGYHDMTFIKYLKEVPGVKTILGVDIESIPSRCSSDLLWDDYVPKRENPLQISLFQGNAADPDYRLIGCDAVVSIEMIEHMLPFDLDRLVHTVFGFIRPRIAVFTTPNGDFNELFKSLEKNGLRRLDHFFEWSREQFNEWCSNIVVRYPEYTVQCRGIGPGPEGTSHLGCCSQLALFVSKDYHKQPNLDLNCLTLMAAAPNPNDIDAMIGGLESAENLLDKNANADQAESLSQLLRSEQQSYMTIILSPPDSTEDLVNCDKMSQCDLDNEAGRDYLMFDDEQLLNHVVRPRRKIDYRVYEMEDVSRRLNCTTLQVKKFSKTTQKLMAKNKIDSLVHTREVVDKIKHLVKLLNFNKNSTEQFQNTSLWNNINWGENAPYWNQYYKIVKEYNYPFEVKSEDCRILDLISDEINRLVDRQLDEEVAFGANRLEIPVQYLMRVVEHITKDDDRVKELLEWNGYQVVNDVVVHTRLIADQVSDGADEEWPEYEPCPDVKKPIFIL